MNQFMKDVILKIKREEGRRLTKYKCPMGFWTIGDGIKLPLTDDEMELLSNSRGYKYTNPYPTKIYEEESDLLLWERLHPIIEQLNDSKLYKNAHFNAQIVMIDLCYQMGFNGFCKFKKMIIAINQGNYGIAGEELKDSLYFKQTPNRAKRNIKLLKKFK